MAGCKYAGELAAVAENPSKDDAQIRCGICIGRYRNPRYLPTCGHTFCENCLLKYTRNIQQEDQGSKFDCPVCRKRNNLPEHDEVTLRWVQTFPLNTVIIKMMEALPHSSDETNEERRICDPCKEEGETNAGLKFCLDCKEALCKSCTKFHKNLKLTKDHKLVDVREMATETNRTIFFTGVGKCDIHPERDVDIYCKKHDTVTCALCFIFDHKSCQMTEISSHNIDIMKLQTDSESLVSQMKAAITHIDRLQKLRVEIKTNLKQQLKEISENFIKVRDQIVELIDNVVSHVSDITKQLEIEKEDGIDIEMSRVTKLKDRTEQNVALLDAIGQHGSERHKFVSVHLMKSQVKEISQQISEEDKHVKQFDAKLVIADKLKELIESTEVEKLVQIEVNVNKSNHTHFSSVPTPRRDTCVVSVLSKATGTRKKCKTRSAEAMPAPPRDTDAAPPRDTDAAANILKDSMLVKVEEHKVYPDIVVYPPRYTGVSVNRDGRIILCDYDNGCLSLYNPANHNLQILTLSGSPYSAVEIGDSRLAVSSPDNRTISIVTVGDELRVEKTLKTRNKPRIIVALIDGMLAIAWKHPPAFGVIDVRGTKVVQTSYLDKDISGRKFKSFDYLAVDETRQHVIQSCTTDKAVYCFHFTGQPVFTYANRGLKNPKGVALDKCGNIYVCESNFASSIHKLSPAGDPISIITAICSDVTGTGFWVTQLRYNVGFVRIPNTCIVVYFRLKENTEPRADIAF